MTLRPLAGGRFFYLFQRISTSGSSSTPFNHCVVLLLILMGSCSGTNATKMFSNRKPPVGVLHQEREWHMNLSIC